MAKQEMSCPHFKRVSECVPCMADLAAMSAPKMVHCVEIMPGAYVVSAEFASEIRKRAQPGELDPIGNISGVEILVSNMLPFEEKKPEIKVNERIVVHKASGGYPHPTLCGQFITMGFNAAESDDEVTCTKCLNRMKGNK